MPDHHARERSERHDTRELILKREHSNNNLIPGFEIQYLILYQVSLSKGRRGAGDQTRVREAMPLSGDIDVVCSAPGKIILFGEHSVVHGRPAVAASAGGALRCYARVRVVQPSQSPPSDVPRPRVTLQLDSFGVSIEWSVSDLRTQLLLDSRAERGAATPCSTPGPASSPHRVDGELREALDSAATTAVRSLADGESVREAVLAFLYLFGSLWCVSAAAPKTAEGDVLVQVWSTLPVGAGMGSSASYSVALAAALLQAAEGPASLGASKMPSTAGGEPGSIALRTAANKWAFECERLFHGAPSGVDNTVCSLGAMRHLLAWHLRASSLEET